MCSIREDGCKINRAGQTGYCYFGARYYSPELSVWLGVDPLADQLPSWTPYHYVHNNPINLIDPDGRSAAPIFSEQGELLGTDSEGWKGEAIVMDKKDFNQGMDHNKAVEKGTELSKYGKGIRISNDDWQEVEKNGGSKMTPYVVNNSSKTAFYKPEGIQNGVDLNPGHNSDNAYPIAPNTDLYAPVDGVATHKYNNAVFKVLTGTNNIRINRKGEVSAKTHPIIVDGWISRGGYYYENGGLLTPGLNDGSWEKLFDRAKSTGGVRY